MSRWSSFTTVELKLLRDLLDEYCERQEDTCDAQADLSDEIHYELSRRDEE